MTEMVTSVDKDYHYVSKIPIKMTPKYLNENVNIMRREMKDRRKNKTKQSLNSPGHSNILSERKISLDGINNRFATTEEKISEYEEKTF